MTDSGARSFFAAVSNHETEQLVAAVFNRARHEAKHSRYYTDAQKITRALYRRVAREREMERFWITVDRVHELAVQAMDAQEAGEGGRLWE